MQAVPDWGRGAFEIRYRPKADPDTVSRAARAQKEAVRLLVSPPVSQDINSKLTSLQQQPPLPPPHTPKLSERLVPLLLTPGGRLDPLPNSGVEEDIEEASPFFAGSGAGPAAAQDGDADAHSRRLCEELRTHGGDRYSLRDARGRRPIAFHTPWPSVPQTRSPCGRRDTQKGRAARRQGESAARARCVAADRGAEKGDFRELRKRGRPAFQTDLTHLA